MQTNEKLAVALCKLSCKASATKTRGEKCYIIAKTRVKKCDVMPKTRGEKCNVVPKTRVKKCKIAL